MAPLLRVAQRVPCTEAEGPGRRFALWLSGCALRCPGCCNPELFDAGAGSETSVSTLVHEIEDASATLGITGITVLGGEPLEQTSGLAPLCEAVARAGLGVIVFTGRRLADAKSQPDFDRLWAAVDTLVDGPFDARRPEPAADAGGRRWIGSANQQLHHRTPRYAAPALWQGPNHAELRVGPAGEITAHGFPPQVRRLLRGLATR